MLFQLPGMAITVLVLSGLIEIWDLQVTTAVVLFALWVAKDLALYPVLKVAYEQGTGGTNGPDALLGNLGVAQEDLNPEGYVKIGSELWRARVAHGTRPIASGAPVRVVRLRNLTVVVEAAHDDAPDGTQQRGASASHE
jgi:membrane protein implicated in regulation of membrane protease activity